MKIVLIADYFGALPPWIEVFLYSCRLNPAINWIYFTEVPYKGIPPGNVVFITRTKADFCELVKRKIAINPCLDTPRKVCDFRPAYGEIYSDYVAKFDFWGHCDVDVIFGDLSLFFPTSVLRTHDIFSSRLDKQMSGHLSLYRNTPIINSAYRTHSKYRKIMSTAEHLAFDESERRHSDPGGITRVVRELSDAGAVKPFWSRNNVNYPHTIAIKRMNHLGVHAGQLSNDDFWIWSAGRLFYLGSRNMEVPYLHFQSWKNNPSFLLNSTAVREQVRIDILGFHDLP